ncbi:MAG: hypothetical protein ACPGSC_13520 [Granulosicoccaceae bacterium]
MSDLNPQAVLTGDIVASQELSADALEQVRVVIEESILQIAQWSENLVPRPVDFSRGDAWQCLLTDPGVALRAALWVRSALLYRCNVDTRVAVGIDTIEPLAANLSRSGGSAFVLSGRSLDELHKRRLSIVLPTSSPFGPWLELSARLCDVIVSSWTQRQAELMHAALAPESLTQSAIAASLQPPITKQAVGKALRAAHWDAISKAMDTFEATDWVQLWKESKS